MFCNDLFFLFFSLQLNCLALHATEKLAALDFIAATPNLQNCWWRCDRTRNLSHVPCLDKFSTILISVVVLQNSVRSLPNDVLSCPQTNELQRLEQQLASSKVKHRPCERTLEPRVQRRIPKIRRQACHRGAFEGNHNVP